jgi:hypothetical protein
MYEGLYSNPCCPRRFVKTEAKSAGRRERASEIMPPLTRNHAKVFAFSLPEPDSRSPLALAGAEQDHTNTNFAARKFRAEMLFTVCKCHANAHPKKRGAARITSFKTSQYFGCRLFACMIAQLVFPFPR